MIALRDHVAEDNPSAAAAIAEAVLRSVERLATQPQMGRPGRIVGTRELVVPGLPYIIPYRVRGERLELIAVFHGRQKWPDKL
jgi:addiction module RelE/StbE family toxin